MGLHPVFVLLIAGGIFAGVAGVATNTGPLALGAGIVVILSAFLTLAYVGLTEGTPDDLAV